jgi:hypothetical protein
MIYRFRAIAGALVAILLLGMAGAGAQTAQSQTSPNPGDASQASSVPTPQAPARRQVRPAQRSTSLKSPRARTGTSASTSRRQLTVGNTNLTAWRVLSKSHAYAILS